MKKRIIYLCLLALSTVLLFSGCRSKISETESETQSETQLVKETETEKATQKATEKETQKTTEKKTGTTEKTSVKPSTTKPSVTKPATPSANNTTSGQVSMCPYCYHYFSIVPDSSDGSSVYSRHVAQEKSWADTFGYGTTSDTNSTPSTDASTPSASQTPSTDAPSGTDDSAQCPYCYQWFTVSDGSYAAHIATENASLGLPQGSDYVTCPKCGNTYKRGIEYDTHYCTGQ